MNDLPLPRDLEAPVGALVRELAEHLGERRVVEICVGLLTGDDRADHADEMPYFTGVVFDEESPKFYPAQWKDYWVRTWGARGLLYVWDDSAAPAVVAGLDDEHWRPAEMCLKVSTKRELGEAGPRAAELAVRASCRECGSRRCAPWAPSATPSTSRSCATVSTTRTPPYAARPAVRSNSSPGGSTSTSSPGETRHRPASRRKALPWGLET